MYRNTSLSGSSGAILELHYTETTVHQVATYTCSVFDKKNYSGKKGSCFVLYKKMMDFPSLTLRYTCVVHCSTNHDTIMSVFPMFDKK